MYTKKEYRFSEIPQLSARDIAYQSSDPRLRPFYKYDANLNEFVKVADDRRRVPVDRDVLVSVLKEQYAKLSDTDAVMKNIDALSKQDTFTIITAHQPSILTGPLYFIYKICSVLSLCKSVNQSYSDFRVVPVFVMGGEDHDFEEIATVHLFGKSFTWETEQSGATGRMSLDGLDTLMQQVYETLGDHPNALELKDKISNSLKLSSSYGEFMKMFVHSLFGKYGLIIANMDQPEYKEKLLPYILQDLENKDSQTLVNAAQEKLEKAGFKSQAHAREINIFWLNQSGRHRVLSPTETESNLYEIDETTYQKEELINLLTSNPGAISPNVILRPIYQEIIFPNLAYVGGGGELAYWIERTSLFKKWGIPYPMLVRRDSFLIMDKKSHAWLADQNVSWSNLLSRREDLIMVYTHEQSDVELDFSTEKKRIETLFGEIAKTAEQIDPTIKKTVGSESAKAIKSLDYIKSKLIKAAKQKNEGRINKLTRIKDKHFPGNNSLQERHDNFMPHYLKHGPVWIDEILTHADPLNKNFKVLIED